MRIKSEAAAEGEGAAAVDVALRGEGVDVKGGVAWGEARWWVLVIALGFVGLHWDILSRLAWFAWTDGDWSHALLVPFISAYFVYQRRERVLGARWEPSVWGGVLMGVSLLGYVAGLWAGSDMLKGYCMVGQLMGLVWAVCGWGVLRWVWFAVLYLVFAVKLDEALWGVVAWRMQLAAAWGAVGLLRAVGVDAVLTGSTIELFEGFDRVGTLTVAEACSGMRLLITFMALGAAAGYLWGRAWWSRLALFVVTVPIAVVVNVLRVTLLGYLYRVDESFAKGDAHVFLGMVMLVPAVLLFMGAAWVIGWIEGSDGDGGGGGGVEGAGGDSGEADSKEDGGAEGGAA